MVNRYLSKQLLIIFLYAITPGALFHEFLGHEDTHCQPGKIAYEKQHLHCHILQILAPVFTFPQSGSLQAVQLTGNEFFPLQPESSSRALVSFTNLRAPPPSRQA